MKTLFPVDTVDAAGNAWETTGENIRHGAKEYSENDIKEVVNILFPVGCFYAGENTFITSVGTWELVTVNSGRQLILGGSSYTTGDVFQGAQLNVEGKVNCLTLRIWKRVS